ncbi:hypothetical protein GCM10009555_100220 [Acrocarpospora macrocephala]|uniref:Lipoprotein n=1 Tax=Acrocarpospora macrocephala TaxID=150177 RepID=A0A5M3X645_9ACTN|nr:hypothetical protein [Acrocarpospora macrocephala]GES16570.1 hypothetical protein Amac_101680 [Acrocarpospora macrocephala]
MKTFAIRKQAVATAALAALTTLTAVAGVSAVAAPAQAASARCVLTITEYDAYGWRINNNCTPARPSDKLVQSVYWGADWPDVDDYLFDNKYPTMNHTFVIDRIFLNEDAATRDEVYTENRFIRIDGSIYTVKSNEVRKQFYPFSDL